MATEVSLTVLDTISFFTQCFKVMMSLSSAGGVERKTFYSVYVPKAGEFGLR